MKKKLTLIAFAVIACITMSSCKVSTEQLTKEVKQHMIEEYQKDGSNIEVKDLTLIHKSGNDYSGIAVLESDGEELKCDVEVVYDGDSFQWKVTPMEQ